MVPSHAISRGEPRRRHSTRLVNVIGYIVKTLRKMANVPPVEHQPPSARPAHILYFNCIYNWGIWFEFLSDFDILMADCSKKYLQKKYRFFLIIHVIYLYNFLFYTCSRQRQLILTLPRSWHTSFASSTCINQYLHILCS